MEIIQKINLDFARNTIPIKVFAKQYDQKTRYIEITPLKFGQKYTIESGVTVRLQLTKPDKTTVITDATITNNIIKAELSYQALAAAGTVTAEIGLYKAETLLSSQVFYIDVEKSAYDANAVKSSNEFNLFIEALNKVEPAVTASENAAKKANDAADKANTAATAANTAKTNANKAATAANAAADSANDAAENANTATTAANDAAATANTAATEANTAKTNANKAATAANTAADSANDAVEKANAATMEANTAAAAANESKANADEATEEALNAAEQARTEAANASTKALDAENATLAANTAATEASAAKEAANSAAETANSATAKAEKAASAVENAINNAIEKTNEATVKAENAAASVESAISEATTATQNAMTATEAANTAASTANEIAEQLSNATAAVESAVNEANTAAQNAVAATESANEAAGAVNIALAEASRVNITAEETPTGADITITDRYGVEKTIHFSQTSTSIETNEWKGVQAIVRAGLGSQYYPIGYEFNEFADKENGTIWVVRGHNHHQVATGYENTMTLESKYAVTSPGFSDTHYLYKTAQSYSAGHTFRFDCFGQSSGSSVRRYITLGQSIPAGGFMNFYQESSTKSYVTTYTPTGVKIEEIDCSSIMLSGAKTELTFSEYTSTSAYCNCYWRSRVGSSNYAQSVTREWLNKGIEGDGLSTIPPKVALTNTNERNFTTRLPFPTRCSEQFLDVIQPAIIPCRTNNTYEIGYLSDEIQAVKGINYNLIEKFFILSQAEVFGTDTDGEQLEYYKNLTDVERIKYYSTGTAQYCALRTPKDAARVYQIDQQGTQVSALGTVSLSAVCPVCVIA